MRSPAREPFVIGLGVEVWRCGFCGKTHRTPGGLLRHMKRKHPAVDESDEATYPAP